MRCHHINSVRAGYVRRRQSQARRGQLLGPQCAATFSEDVRWGCAQAAEPKAPSPGEDSFWDRDAPPPPSGVDLLAGRVQAPNLALGHPAAPLGAPAPAPALGGSAAPLASGVDELLSLGATPVRVGGRAPATGAAMHVGDRRLGLLRVLMNLKLEQLKSDAFGGWKTCRIWHQAVSAHGKALACFVPCRQTTVSCSSKTYNW